MAPCPKPCPEEEAQAHGGVFGSAIHAWRGLIRAVVHQRNMRLHVISALLVSLVGSGIPLGLAEKVILIFCVLLVLFAEVLNTALEQLVDLATEQMHPRAKVAKDAAAAGVLILALGTTVVFTAVLFHNIDTVFAWRSQVLRQVVLGVPLTCCAWLLLRRGWRPPWLDLAASAGSIALWVILTQSSRSSVFSAMTLGFLVMSMNAAVQRRRDNCYKNNREDRDAKTRSEATEPRA